MNKFALQRSALTVILGLALAVGAPARPKPAPQSEPVKQPTVYTYVSFFGVPRADWAKFEAANKESEKIMSGLVADGTIVGWGDAAVEVHEGLTAPTHVAWFSSMTVAGLTRTLAATRAGAPPSGEINYTMHSDEILMSNVYNWKTGAGPGKFLLVQDWTPKAGQGEQMHEFFVKHRKPELDALVSDGSIGGYALDSELIHTQAPGPVSLVVEFTSAESMDKFYKQIETMQDKEPLFGMAFSTTIETAAHRDHLLRILAEERK